MWNFPARAKPHSCLVLRPKCIFSYSLRSRELCQCKLTCGREEAVREGRCVRESDFYSSWKSVTVLSPPTEVSGSRGQEKTLGSELLLMFPRASHQCQFSCRWENWHGHKLSTIPFFPRT